MSPRTFLSSEGRPAREQPPLSHPHPETSPQEQVSVGSGGWSRYETLNPTRGGKDPDVVVSGDMGESRRGETGPAVRRRIEETGDISRTRNSRRPGRDGTRSSRRGPSKSPEGLPLWSDDPVTDPGGGGRITEWNVDPFDSGPYRVSVVPFQPRPGSDSEVDYGSRGSLPHGVDRPTSPVTNSRVPGHGRTDKGM